MPQFNSPFTDPQLIQQELEKRHLRLRQIEAEYLRLKTYLGSLEWQEKRDKIFMRLTECLAQYRQGQDATAAVYTVAQAKQILLEVQEVTDVIVEYEDIQQKLKSYYATRQQE